MGVEYQKLLESKRSNRAQETETNRSNLAREAETNRSNLANERIRQGTLDEQVRSNQANEAIKRDTLTETQRHNVVTEGIQNREADISEAKNVIESDKLSETIRANQAKELETNRSNVAKETLDNIRALPEGGQQIASLSNYVQHYGSNIDDRTRRTINKYTSLAVAAGAGTKAYTNYLNKALNTLTTVIGGFTGGKH